MKVLVACEFSGIVREAFRKRGHDAWSCDLLPTEIPSRFHYQEDIRNHLDEYYDLVIFHPICTRLANSGVRWLKERNLWGNLHNGAEFFNLRHKFNSPRVGTENPIPHKYAINLIGKYSQIIQPWQFGHPETKAICLWLENLPPLIPTNIVSGREGRIWKESPGPDRWKRRSRFYPGIADAMAEQWGGL